MFVCVVNTRTAMTIDYLETLCVSFDTGSVFFFISAILTSIDYFPLTNHTGHCKTNFPLKLKHGKVVYIIFCAAAAKFGPEM